MTGDPDDADPVHPATIRTARLALVPMSSPLVHAVLNRDWVTAERLLGSPFPVEWRDDGWQWLEPQATLGRDDDRFVAWGTRVARPAAGDVLATGPVLAEVGFHGPPDVDGRVELGYRVVAAHRRRGLAEEAVRGLLAWAWARGVAGVTASVGADNVASLGLLAKLGFTADGSHRHPVLGEQLVFRTTPAAPV